MLTQLTRTVPGFSTRLIAKGVYDGPQMHRLIRWCTAFERSGLSPSYSLGTYGNLSFRLMKGLDAFVITSTKLPAKTDLTSADFVVVHSCDIAAKEVNVFSMMKEPSSETMLHYMIYNQRPDVNAVFHGHDDSLTKNYGHLGLRCTPAELPFGTPELAQAAIDALGKDYFVILRNHGFVSCGVDMNSAGDQALNVLRRRIALDCRKALAY